jgi:hypothetical protein
LAGELPLERFSGLLVKPLEVEEALLELVEVSDVVGGWLGRLLDLRIKQK